MKNLGDLLRKKRRTLNQEMLNSLLLGEHSCSNSLKTAGAGARKKRERLTCGSHVLTGPDGLEADKRDLHRQNEPHDVERTVS